MAKEKMSKVERRNKRKYDQRRQLSKYNEEIEEGEKLNTLDATRLDEYREKLDNVYESVKDTTVGKEEAELLKNLGGRVTKHVVELDKQSRRIDIGTFLRCIAHNDVFKDGNASTAVSWRKLGEIGNIYYNGISSGTFMFGCLNVEPRPRQTRQHHGKKDEKGDHNKPDTIKDDDVGPDGKKKRDHHAFMQKRLDKIIRPEDANGKRRKRDFLDLVVNPQSFTQTVENIFEFSFLVKDEVRMKCEEGKAVTVEVIPEKDTKAVSNESVLSFSMEDWEEVVNGKLVDPLLEHRKDPVYKGCT